MRHPPSMAYVVKTDNSSQKPVSTHFLKCDKVSTPGRGKNNYLEQKSNVYAIQPDQC